LLLEPVRPRAAVPCVIREGHKVLAPPLPALRGRRKKRKKHDNTEEVDQLITGWALEARGGDAEAVERFIRALHCDVLRYVAHLSADPQSADDLTQETFIRALGSLHRFEGRSSARAWLLSIARRAVIDDFRRAAARPRLADRHDWRQAAEQTQPVDMPGFEEGVALLDLLATLPDERREAFILTQLVGLSYMEAAEVTDCPVGTIRSRVARARATLLELLAEPEQPCRESGDPLPAVRPSHSAVAVLAAAAA
jgi:RNA polymerase sigma-70 factor (ECF subfamily)